jgi:putative oxidoreductase
MLRLTLGGVMLPHGAQKLLGVFGGHGFWATLGFFTGTLNIPWLLAFVVIVLESFGSAALILGFLTRPVAFGLASIMVGAVAFVHWQNGFFMNWFGEQRGEGFEYHILAFGIALALMATGGGRHSVDPIITTRFAGGERGLLNG